MLHVTSTKKLFALTLLTLSSFSMNTYAAKAAASANSKVELKSNLPVTQEEIATVNVLGEICPKILGKNPAFDRGYRYVLADLLPNFSDPVLAVRALQDDPDYQKVLKDARVEAGKATVQENRDVCLEVSQYKPPVVTSQK